MITASAIQGKIDGITGVDTRSRNRREYLRLVIKCIENESSEKYYQDQLGIVDKKLVKLKSSMPVYLDLKGMEKKKKQWEEENGIPALKLQLRTLRLILGQ